MLQFIFTEVLGLRKKIIRVNSFLLTSVHFNDSNIQSGSIVVHPIMLPYVYILTIYLKSNVTLTYIVLFSFNNSGAVSGESNNVS